MALFFLRKLILQMRMRIHPVGLDVYFWLDPLSTSILHVCEQRSLWWDCVDARLAWAFAGRLCDKVPYSHELAQLFTNTCKEAINTTCEFTFFCLGTFFSGRGCPHALVMTNVCQSHISVQFWYSFATPLNWSSWYKIQQHNQVTTEKSQYLWQFAEKYPTVFYQMTIIFTSPKV